MRVWRLRIEGFRGASKADIRFGEHCVLIGPNNCGKTTIVEALALLFGRDRMVRRLTEHDFHGSSPSAKSRIIIVATVTDFPGNNPDYHPAWFGASRGTEKWINPQTGELSAKPESPDWKLAVQVAFAARFDLQDLEAETVRFFVDDEGTIGDPFSVESPITQIPGATLQELGFFLVPASRTWDRWISFTSELFRRVVSSIGGVPANAIRKERERLWKPPEGHRLEQETGLKEIVDATNKELEHLIASVPALELRLTSTDSASVLDAVVPHYRQGGAPSLPTSRHGSGLVSLQSLLLLMQFGRARRKDGKSFVLALEEPELHIQPSQQKRLVNRVNALCDQTIVTTHSPLVASMFSPDQVLFAESNDGVLAVCPLAERIPAKPTNHIQHLFFGWRQRLIAALMHECVLVPEGPSDVSWLEILQREIELRQEWDNDERDGMRFGTFIGVVPTNDAKIIDTLGVVNRVHSNPAVLIDGDDEGERYLEAIYKCDSVPRTVLIWPEGWKMETVIGWIAEADKARVLGEIGAVLGQTFADTEELVNYLLGKKTYLPDLEATGAILIANDACRKRASELLGAMADVLNRNSKEHALFEVMPAKPGATLRVFRLKQ